MPQSLRRLLAAGLWLWPALALGAGAAPDPAAVGAAALETAQQALARGDGLAAERALQHALAQREAALGRTHPAVATVLDALAALALRRDDAVAVQDLGTRALAIRHQALGPETAEAAPTVLILAEQATRAGDFAAASTLLREALAYAVRAWGPHHARVAGLWAARSRLAQARDAFAQAESYGRAALAAGEGSATPLQLALWQTDLAAAELALGQAGAARTLLEQALGRVETQLADDDPGRAAALANAARGALEAGAYADALEKLQRAETLARAHAVGPEGLLGEVLALRMETRLRQGDVAGALEAEKAALTALDCDLRRWQGVGTDRQRWRLAQRQLSQAAAAVRLHLEVLPRDKIAAALAFSAVAQRPALDLAALADTSAARRRRLPTGERELADELQATRERLAWLATEEAPESPTAARLPRRREWLQLAQRQESQLLKQSPRQRAEWAPLQPAQVAALLPPDAVFVTYVRYAATAVAGGHPDSHSAAYVLDKTGEPQGVDLGSAATIDAAVSAFRAALATPSGDAQPAAAAVSRLILAPIFGLVRSARQWWIQPDGALALVPFAALVEPDGRWVLERRTVTLRGGGTDLLRPRSPPTTRSEAWVLAGAEPSPSGTVGGSTKAPLATEAEAVAPLLGARPHLAATPELLRRLHAPRILHLAVRCALQASTVVRPARPPLLLPFLRPPSLPSAPLPHPLRGAGLALSSATDAETLGGAGSLTAGDVIGLDLRGTQLVVLSACDAQPSRAGDTAGAAALRRAFDVAGADALLMSLWRVDDEALYGLLTSFYGKLSATEGRSEALRRAQLELLTRPRTQAPYFWAALQLIGDPRPLR